MLRKKQERVATLAELIDPALRVWIVRRRYAMAGKRSLRNFDWDRGIWLAPPSRTRRFGLRPFVARAAMVFGATVTMGLGVTQFEGVSRAASNFSDAIAARIGVNGALCQTGTFRLGT